MLGTGCLRLVPLYFIVAHVLQALQNHICLLCKFIIYYKGLRTKMMSPQHTHKKNKNGYEECTT